MPLIVPKEVLLNSFKNVAQKGLMDKDYLVTKLQIMVTEGDLTQEDVQPIIEILYPSGNEQIDS
ncbi:hypothetical protein CSTERTH_01120 [Thermoclostridium stercorarium subsp. thermolacticum DSM 2910]|uniref:Uncharacterized protein n=1 Tax=Thermoclostridium stercorarium subsp. thermolacticum DSM 2910 TaxID=1121336 RepID=A0A1B1YAH6_THEST|nr:hypothetical protein [Thermoclostridium stercorarium]ANW97729.1 hypothetical protein CSTERTH_01120 [Thermoclostridium stercorarium subsp. thermolacticum DSM 2910]